MKNIFQALDGEEPSVFRIWTTDKEYHHLLSSESYHGICRIGGFLIFYHPRYLSGIAPSVLPSLYYRGKRRDYRVLCIKSWEITKRTSIASVHSGVGYDRYHDIRMYFIRYRNFRRRSSYLYDVWLRFSVN